MQKKKIDPRMIEHTSLVILKITETDDQGRPCKAEIYYEKDVGIAVENGTEFVTAWVKPRVVRKKD